MKLVCPNPIEGAVDARSRPGSGYACGLGDKSAEDDEDVLEPRSKWACMLCMDGLLVTTVCLDGPCLKTGDGGTLSENDEELAEDRPAGEASCDSEDTGDRPADDCVPILVSNFCNAIASSEKHDSLNIKAFFIKKIYEKIKQKELYLYNGMQTNRNLQRPPAAASTVSASRLAG